MDNTTATFYTAPSSMVYELSRALEVMGVVLGIGSILLNAIFLIIMRLVMKDRSSAYHRLVNNLSASDLLASFAFLITQNWPLGPFAHIEPLKDFIIVEGLPYVFRGLPWMFFTGYLLTLSCMSLNQYIAVCQPWRYSTMVTRAVITRTLVGVWLFSSLQILVPLFVLFILNVKANKADAMMTLFTVSKIEMQVWLVIYATSTIFNIVINVGVYSKIRSLKKERRFGGKTTQESQNLRTKQAAFVTVSLLLGVSVACRLPFPVFAMVGISVGFETNVAQLLNAVVVFLLYVNFFADPIIHVMRMNEVQKAVKGASASCLAPLCCRKTTNGQEMQNPQEMTIGLITRDCIHRQSTQLTVLKDIKDPNGVISSTV